MARKRAAQVADETAVRKDAPKVAAEVAADVQAAAVEHVPSYDPQVHTDANEVVFLEFYCQCGFLMRQRDPVWAVADTARQLLAQHAGPGHGPASKAECIAEREAQREAAFRVVGRAAEYRPKDHPNLDVTCTKPRPWPVFPDEQAGVAPVEG